MSQAQHQTTATLMVILGFFFGLCVGAKWGAMETVRAYGLTHPEVFETILGVAP